MATGLNSTVRAGEGDAPILSWNNLDKATNQLYAEQKQREAQGYREYAAHNQMLQKEFANVRSADIPDVMDTYGKYKQLRQAMLFDNSIKNNPLKFAKAQQDANAALADLNQKINSSAEVKDFDKGLAADMARNRDLYDDNASPLFAKAAQLPTSKRIEAGLNSAEPFLWKGANMNLQPLFTAANGSKVNTITEEKPVDGGLQSDIITYSRTATPDEYKNNLIQGAATQKAGRALYANYAKVPQEQKNLVDEQYQKLLDDKDYWHRLGTNPQTLDYNPDDKTQEAATFYAKLHALNNPAQASSPKRVTNEAGKLKAQADIDAAKQQRKFAMDKAMEGIRQGNRKALVELKRGYQNADKAEQNDIVDSMLNSQDEEAKNSGTHMEYKNTKGEVTKEREVKAPEMFLDVFSKTENGHKIRPDAVYLMDNGNYRPVFYNVDANTNQPIKGKDGTYSINQEMSKPVLRKSVKFALGKTLLSKKDLANTDYDNSDSDSDNDTEDENDYDAVDVLKIAPKAKATKVQVGKNSLGLKF